MMRLLEAFLALLLILMFFSLMPVALWILKLVLALGFLLIAYDAYKEGKGFKAAIFLVLAIVFQPIVAIPLGKAIWYVIQLAVLLWLIGLIFKPEKL